MWRYAICWSCNCNLVNSIYQEASKVLSTFVPDKQFGLLINILPHSLRMSKTTILEIHWIMVYGSK